MSTRSGGQRILFRVITIAGVAGSLCLFGQQADNTAANKDQQTSAQSQGTSAADRDLTKKIRREIVKDKTLSTYAHNIKVISKDGQVTLKGPVNSEDEKKNLEAKAAELAGASNVKNELTVKGESN